MSEQNEQDEMTSPEVVDADAPADVRSIIGSAESGAGDPTGAGVANHLEGNSAMGERYPVGAAEAAGGTVGGGAIAGRSGAVEPSGSTGAAETGAGSPGTSMGGGSRDATSGVAATGGLGGATGGARLGAGNQDTDAGGGSDASGSTGAGISGA